MFNKTAIIKREKTKSYKSKPKIRELYNMKKSLTNLRISFANNNNSSNTSNINLETSSNTKRIQESASIHKVQTQKRPAKKSIFDDKDKESSHTIFAKKSAIINSQNYPLSVKDKINFKIKIRSRSHLNTEENEIKNNKAYYLTGEVPFRDRYIIEIKDYNSNIKNENKNKIIKSKNEFIQCDSSINNQNNLTLKNKILNMRKKDKRIDKLAKKLAIKLDLEDKKISNQSKCGCGNLITLNNGFLME